VCAGENDVCRAVIEDAGDWRFRSFDLSFRLNRCGTRSCIDRHGICRCILENVPSSLSFHDGKVVDMIHSLWRRCKAFWLNAETGNGLFRTLSEQRRSNVTAEERVTEGAGESGERLEHRGGGGTVAGGKIVRESTEQRAEGRGQRAEGRRQISRCVRVRIGYLSGRGGTGGFSAEPLAKFRGMGPCSFICARHYRII
jgi:hypothetical protein